MSAPRGGCPRPRLPRRPSSPRSRGQCAPACDERRRGPGRCLRCSSRAPSWPLWTGLKEPTGECSNGVRRRQGAALRRGSSARTDQSGLPGLGYGISTESKSRGTIARSNASAGLFAHLARRVARRECVSASSVTLGLGGQLRRRRAVEWPVSAARAASSSGNVASWTSRSAPGPPPRHLAGRGVAREHQPAAGPRVAPIAGSARRPPSRPSRRAGGGRSGGPGDAELAARPGIEPPGPRVLDQCVSQRRAAVVHLDRRRRVAVAVRSSLGSSSTERTSKGSLPYIAPQVRISSFSPARAVHRQRDARARAGRMS